VFRTEQIAPGFEQVFAAVVDLLERLPAPNLSEENQQAGGWDRTCRGWGVM
jgi:hypothetical protein